MLLALFLCLAIPIAVLMLLAIISIEDRIKLRFALKSLQDKQSPWFQRWVTSNQQSFYQKDVVSISICLQNERIFCLAGVATGITAPLIFVYLSKVLILQNYRLVQITLITFLPSTLLNHLPVLSFSNLILKIRFYTVIDLAETSMAISKFH